MLNFHLQTNTKIFFLSLAFIAMCLSLFFVHYPVSTLIHRLVTAPNKPAQNSTEQTPTEQTPASSTAPAASQTPTTNSSQGTTCNTSQKNAFTTQYNNQVAAENNRHNAQISFIQSSIHDPNQQATAINQENVTHATNLSNINSQYQSNLRSIGC